MRHVYSDCDRSASSFFVLSLLYYCEHIGPTSWFSPLKCIADYEAWRVQNKNRRLSVRQTRERWRTVRVKTINNIIKAATCRVRRGRTASQCRACTVSDVAIGKLGMSCNITGCPLDTESTTKTRGFTRASEAKKKKKTHASRCGGFSRYTFCNFSVALKARP